MSAEDTPSDDFTARLLACEEALAAGAPLPAPEGNGVPPELRARLEKNVACLKLLQQLRPGGPPGDPPAATLSAPAPAPAAEPPLTALARFQVRRELGRGGFGIVYLAFDPQLCRDVALKVPRSDLLSGPELRERFVAEARAAARLDHPNLVPVYDADVLGPVSYIAYAYCPGLTLAQWLRQRGAAVPPGDAARLLVTLARAVQHAHERGVVHRDLKPANVLLQRRTTTDSTDSTDKKMREASSSVLSVVDFVPKIADFGLAKLLAEGEAGPTRSQVILGTPSYMAPEQAAGKSRSVGPAADVHALGAILYELLTGRPPFRGESDLETLRQVLEQEPRPPRSLNRLVDPGLEAVCLKCLEKRPAQRYRSAGALADDLERCLHGQAPRPRRWPARAGRALRRHPIAIAAALLLGAAALLVEAERYLSDPGRRWAAAQAQLARGRAVSLVEGDRPARWARWVTGNGKGRTFTAEDGALGLEAGGANERALMELADRVGAPSFRFAAEVRHNRTASKDGYLGLYFGREAWATEQGTEHFFCALEFNDLRDEPAIPPPQRPVPPGPHWGNMLRLSLVRYRDPVPSRGDCNYSKRVWDADFRPATPETGAEPWHRLAVEVTPEEVRLFWDNERQPRGRVPRAVLDARAGQLCQAWPPPEGIRPTFPPDGGLGLCLSQASGSFRNVVLTPLAENE
jgi:serine/threonine-protein kinase